MALFMTWSVLCALVAMYANSKARSAIGAFVIAFLLSPVIGFIVVAIWKKNEGKLEQQAVFDGTLKKCPQCAEAVKREALICRFCQHQFDPASFPIASTSGIDFNRDI